MSSIPRSVRALVLDRDNTSCVSCSRPVNVSAGAYSIQHRIPRGMGGSKDPRLSLPSNLITLCGSATTPGGCHQWAETYRNDAKEQGYLLYRLSEPSKVAVYTYTGWTLSPLPRRRRPPRSCRQEGRGPCPRRPHTRRVPHH